MFLAAIPFAVLQLDRALRSVVRIGGAGLLAALLLVAAAVPLIVEGSQQQPLRQSVDDLRDGVSALTGWARMEGRIVTLTAPDAVASGQQVQSLLIEPSGDAIVLISAEPLEGRTMVTGRISNSAEADVTARRVGGPRFPDEDLEVIDRYVLSVDDPIVPAENRNWLPTASLTLLAGVLIAGRWVGYPIVRLRRDAGPSRGARPLALDEEVAVRVVEVQEETGARLRAPRGVLRRLRRLDRNDPYFALRHAGAERPALFRRHRWSLATAGTLWTISERIPVVHLHDWGLEVLLAVGSEAEQDRLLASFAQTEDDEILDLPSDARVPQGVAGGTR